MSPPTRGREATPDDTIRTHIDQVSQRVEGGFRQVNARIGEVERGLNAKLDQSNVAIRDRIESRSQLSTDRFARHEKEDERRLNEIAADVKESKESSRESMREMKVEIGTVSTKLDALTKDVQGLALKEAASTGKLAGIVLASSAAVGVVGWLLNTFVVPLLTH